MFETLNKWNGSVEINGQLYDSVKDMPSFRFGDSDTVTIRLIPKVVKEKAVVSPTASSGEVRITVKPYMMRKATPDFDFMAKWNDDKPMPLRTMTGVVVKETRGMKYMKLHGDIWATKICTCMKCGKPLTNPVSQFFGIGPECGGHNYVNPFNTDEELKQAVSEYKRHLQEVVWEGWVIKSAILEEVSA